MSCFLGHALRRTGYQHRRNDGQVDSTNGLPCRYHQQEPIRAAAHAFHHRQPGAFLVRTGNQDQQQVRLSLFYPLQLIIFQAFSLYVLQQ